jgi:hypothetical protein
MALKSRSERCNVSRAPVPTFLIEHFEKETDGSPQPSFVSRVLAVALGGSISGRRNSCIIWWSGIGRAAAAASTIRAATRPLRTITCLHR